jgi:hypothetical protein
MVCCLALGTPFSLIRLKKAIEKRAIQSSWQTGIRREMICQKGAQKVRSHTAAGLLHMARSKTRTKNLYTALFGGDVCERLEVPPHDLLKIN